MRFRIAAVAIAAVAAVEMTAGCQGGGRIEPEVTAPSGVTRAPTVIASAVALPSIGPGPDAHVLWSLSERNEGSYTSAPLRVTPGDLRIMLYCTGGGTARIEVVPTNTFTHSCESDSVTPIMDVITLSQSATVTIRAEASSGTRWALMVSLMPSSTG